ncbi:unnamed protein product [Sphagnum jensenii]|uniref:DYW domain-containing protein n=1 Tax=Sphagnum jensenii TaxID=128206 RepID=A0ABP0W2H2_9BRYO
MEDASRVFKKTPSLDVVPWNTMICGHVKSGQWQKALELFQEMQKEGVQPDLRTFVGLLNACANVVALEEGRHAHRQIIEHGWDSDIIVGNSLIDMYSRCGSLEDACKVFESMASHDVITWNAMISEHVKCGEGQKALELFHQMEQEGLVVEGLCCYASMSTIHKISAKLEHYTCMVDLLGHAGHLQEADNMIKAIPYYPNVAVWMALLGACRIHGNVEMAEHVVKQVLELEPENATVCRDCRSSTKFISKIVGRASMVRDVTHFQERVCSCMDYW